MIARGLASFAAVDLLDEDGRPVAELASPHYAAVPTAIVACPYADRRRGAPMNASALHQLRAVWPEVVATARALAGPAPTVHDALGATVCGLVAPLAAGAPVPRLLSAWFKTSLGFSQVLTALLLADESVAGAPLSALGERDAFFGALDAQGWLLGAEQACAGPRRSILELYDALAGEPGPAAIHPAVLAAGDPARWRRDGLAALGLVIAHHAAVAAAARAGLGPVPPREAAWLAGEVPPWQRAVAAIPGRPAAHALRLFPPGEAPAAVRAYLDAGPAAPSALAERFDAALDAIDAA